MKIVFGPWKQGIVSALIGLFFANSLAFLISAITKNYSKWFYFTILSVTSLLLVYHLDNGKNFEGYRKWINKKKIHLIRKNALKSNEGIKEELA